MPPKSRKISVKRANQTCSGRICLSDKHAFPARSLLSTNQFSDGGFTHKEALQLAISTWPKEITPVVHYSESIADEYNDPTIRRKAHSDYIINKIKTDKCSLVDTMIEAKATEKALVKYRTKYIL